MDNFEQAVALVLLHEGGYVDDPKDQGGETRWGISKAAFPHVDIKNLTLSEAKQIYLREYWDKYQWGTLAWPLAYVMFDCVVQFSPRNPLRWLQAALGVPVDGILGPGTLKAARECPEPEKAACKVMLERQEYRLGHRQYDHFGRGWRKRDMLVLFEAVRRGG